MKTHFVLRNNELGRANQENDSYGLLQSHAESFSADQFWQSLQKVQPQRSAPRGLISSFWPLRDETFGELYRAASSSFPVCLCLLTLVYFSASRKLSKGSSASSAFYILFISLHPPVSKCVFLTTERNITFYSSVRQLAAPPVHI